MGLTFAAADGTALAYRDEGAGTPVLALAGLTRTMADFDAPAPHLPPCRLIRMDYRGRGESGWSGPATYTVAQEAADALALLDHLGVARAAVLGTSRGGLIGMFLAAVAKDRLTGLCLNDIGPEIDRGGLARIRDYVGRPPRARTHAEAAARLPGWSPGFDGVPSERWLAEARRLYVETPAGLGLRYDPALREAFLAGYSEPPADLWPLWTATKGMPVAVIRGANSDLLTRATVARMAEVRPDLITAEVPGRAHIPFLDEPEAVAAIRTWIARLPA
jgi:pimeloyl-ACP methyl ester carboxylesterase